MSPWTALLNSLHSALVDELTDRHPEPKPELGMPIRQKDPAFPAADLPEALVCEVIFASEGGELKGFALLGVDGDFSKKLKLNAQAAWDALIKRAGGEFLHHKIKPRFGNPVAIKNPGAGKTIELPKGFAVPGRVIWIPFKLNPGVCYLGIGA